MYTHTNTQTHKHTNKHGKRKVLSPIWSKPIHMMNNIIFDQSLFFWHAPFFSLSISYSLPLSLSSSYSKMFCFALMKYRATQSLISGNKLILNCSLFHLWDLDFENSFEKHFQNSDLVKFIMCTLVSRDYLQFCKYTKRLVCPGHQGTNDKLNQIRLFNVFYKKFKCYFLPF